MGIHRALQLAMIPPGLASCHRVCPEGFPRRGGPIAPEDSVRGMLSLVDRFQPTMPGELFRFDVTRLAW